MTKSTIRYSKKSVLIVDDFSQYASSLKGMMVSLGSKHIDIAYNGETAIQACKEHQYDIILCDYNLGDSKDGQQVLEELHKDKLLKKNTVFIIVTAENTRNMVMGVVELQPDCYLNKPFNTDMLKFKLDKGIIRKDIMAPVDNLMRDYHYKKAIKKCEKIRELQPKFKMACLWREFLCLKYLKQYPKALKLAATIVHEKPVPWAMIGLGEIFYEKGELEKAEISFRDAVYEFPMMLRGHDMLAKVQHELDKTEAAQKTLSKAIDISPKVLKRQKSLGQFAEENGDVKTMTNAYRQAVKYGKHSALASPDEYIKLVQGLGMLLQENSELDKERLIDEANSVFVKLSEQFDYDPTTKFRTTVAQAFFSSVIKDEHQKKKHLMAVNKLFDRVEEIFNVDDSLEISGSLKSLGRAELAEVILEDAVEQYFSDPKFMKKAAKLTTNKHLLINAEKAEEYNQKATKFFNNKKYSEAIELFIEASKIAPNNVDINLNHAQALLKSYTSDKTNRNYLSEAASILNNIPCLSIKDPRHNRHLELIRLTQIIEQSH